MIDEASRERFIYPFKEQSPYSTIQFVKITISFFGYKPKIIQTDNGFEFTHFKDTKRIHPFDVLCNQLDIKHQLIRPRTPWLNGKVERNHRNDNKRFYKYLPFYSYDYLINQMKKYLYRSNRLPMQTLGWLTLLRKGNSYREASFSVTISYQVFILNFFCLTSFTNVHSRTLGCLVALKI